MSKTAQELQAEGKAHEDAGRKDQAVECYTQAFTVDPNFGEAYASKAFILKPQGKYQEAIDLYKKALEAGYKQYWVYYNLGNIYTFFAPNREEACRLYDIALGLSPDNPNCLLNKGNALIALGKLKEAQECLLRSVEKKSTYPETYALAGSIHEDNGKTAEAMALYDQGLQINGIDYKCNLFKANLLAAQGKTEEAIRIYTGRLAAIPNDALFNYRLAAVYTSLGRPQDASKCYENGALNSPQNAASNCSKGQCLNMLGRTDEAMACFKKAQEIMNAGVELYAPKLTEGIKSALKAVLEAEETAQKVEKEVAKEVAKLDQNSAVVQKFKTNIKALQEKKMVVQNQIIDDANNKKGNEQSTVTVAMSELDKIKAEFQKQLEDLKKEMTTFKTEVETKITKLENKMEDIKEELSNKLDDFNKKLDVELNKQDLNDEDKAKVKGYFTAFIGTFSSAHVTAQVVDSGQVSLDSSNSAATILSFMASFTPFIGSALQSGVKSLGEFLKSKEMITNARKMKNLAPDAVTLSQVIGKSGFGIAQDKKKQQEIIKITDDELNEKGGNLLEKMLKLCDDVSEKLDSFLYTQLYKTPAERLGHNDANLLIEKWVNRKVAPYSIENQFIKMILSPEEQTKTPEAGVVAQSGRSSCCNMF